MVIKIKLKFLKIVEVERAITDQTCVGLKL